MARMARSNVGMSAAVRRFASASKYAGDTCSLPSKASAEKQGKSSVESAGARPAFKSAMIASSVSRFMRCAPSFQG